LGDVNGVSRFIQNISFHTSERGFSGSTAGRALIGGVQGGHAFCSVASTRFEVPASPNIRNFKPQFAMNMPGYANLELTMPPADEMMEFAREFKPDAVHVSTPGPVGWIGRRVARRLGVPLLGTYHTDFPAYIQRLFGSTALTWMTRRYIRTFYRPFDRIFSRSEEYVSALVDLGYPKDRINTLKPGICLQDYSPQLRDDAWFSKFTGLDTACMKFVYVGRLSVKKNLPFLVEVWDKASAQCQQLGLNVALVVVGDGPYGQRMRHALRDRGVFLGFHGQPQLSKIYASCDVFVFPSITDTLGQVVMEAQASGLPAMVSNIGGPASIVKHGVTGSVLACDVQTWVDAIVQYAQNHERVRISGQRAHELMQQHTIEASFDAFWKMHEQECAQSLLRNDRQE